MRIALPTFTPAHGMAWSRKGTTVLPYSFF